MSSAEAKSLSVLAAVAVAAEADVVAYVFVEQVAVGTAMVILKYYIRNVMAARRRRRDTTLFSSTLSKCERTNERTNKET